MGIPHFKITEEIGMAALRNNLPKNLKKWKRTRKIKKALLYVLIALCCIAIAIIIF